MSKIITSAAIRGAHKIVTRVENKYKEVLEKYGPDQAIELPDTGYYLPIIYGMTGIPIATLGDCQPVLRRRPGTRGYMDTCGISRRSLPGIVNN